MTAQRTDTIIINGTEYKLYSLPLTQYFEQSGQTLSLFGGSTTLWRGYCAKWLLENSHLYLTDFWGENFLLHKEYSLNDLFPNMQRVFAEWFTGDLKVPLGNKVKYFHGGLGGWTHEYNATIKIDKGLITETNFNDI